MIAWRAGSGQTRMWSAILSSSVHFMASSASCEFIIMRETIVATRAQMKLSGGQRARGADRPRGRTRCRGGSRRPVRVSAAGRAVYGARTGATTERIRFMTRSAARGVRGAAGGGGTPARRTGDCLGAGGGGQRAAARNGRGGGLTMKTPIPSRYRTFMRSVWLSRGRLSAFAQTMRNKKTSKTIWRKAG